MRSLLSILLAESLTGNELIDSSDASQVTFTTPFAAEDRPITLNISEIPQVPCEGEYVSKGHYRLGIQAYSQKSICAVKEAVFRRMADLSVTTDYFRIKLSQSDASLLLLEVDSLANEGLATSSIYPLIPSIMEFLEDRVEIDFDSDTFDKLSLLERKPPGDIV
jgi:hypothetical protein